MDRFADEVRRRRSKLRAILDDADHPSDWRRALELLAGSPEGVTDAALLARSFKSTVIAGLVDSGLATSTTERKVSSPTSGRCGIWRRRSDATDETTMRLFTLVVALPLDPCRVVIARGLGSTRCCCCIILVHHNKQTKRDQVNARGRYSP